MRATSQIVRPMQAVDGADSSTRNGFELGCVAIAAPGEQIVAKYFPGAAIATQPSSKPFRVLLSAPSTACFGRTIWDVARMQSAGGMRLVNDADPSQVYFDAA